MLYLAFALPLCPANVHTVDDPRVDVPDLLRRQVVRDLSLPLGIAESGHAHVEDVEVVSHLAVNELLRERSRAERVWVYLVGLLVVLVYTAQSLDACEHRVVSARGVKHLPQNELEPVRDLGIEVVGEQSPGLESASARGLNDRERDARGEGNQA